MKACVCKWCSQAMITQRSFGAKEQVPAGVCLELVTADWLCKKANRLGYHQIDTCNDFCYADIAVDVPLIIRRWSRGGAKSYRSRCIDCGHLRGY